MKFAIAGAGAVGSHYGSLLQQAGFATFFLARGEHLRMLKAQGLRHESMGGQRQLAVDAGDDPAGLKDADIILICCKTTGLEALCRQIRPFVAADAVLVTLQNGVEAPDIVASIFPGHPLIAGSAFIGARIEAPGHLIHSAAGHLRLGLWRGEGAKALQAIVQAFEKAGVDAAAVADARRLLWQKMVWNCGFNAITALTRRYARDIACDGDTAMLATAAMQETCDVAAALSVQLDIDEPRRQLALTRGVGPVKTSMWQDIEQRRGTEIEAMNGYIAARSGELGLAAPVNAMLATLVRALQQAI